MLMQNENGPCPLLALSNVLFLRGALQPLHPDVPKVHISELTAMLAELILETNTPSETDAGLRANLQKNLEDGIALFPKLQVSSRAPVKVELEAEKGHGMHPPATPHVRSTVSSSCRYTPGPYPPADSS